MNSIGLRTSKQDDRSSRMMLKTASIVVKQGLCRTGNFTKLVFPESAFRKSFALYFRRQKGLAPLIPGYLTESQYKSQPAAHAAF